jgi:hypothetical protein
MKVLKNEQDKTTKLLEVDISYKGKGKKCLVFNVFELEFA